MAELTPREDLLEDLRLSLAETWAFAFKAHSFHWNVKGPTFSQLHAFFGEIYDDCDGAIDHLAEEIRALGEMAPGSLSEIVAPATITFSDGIPDAKEMVKQLAADNEKVMTAIYDALDCAEELDEGGLANFLQERCDQHAKWGWMLKATGELKTKFVKLDQKSSEGRELERRLDKKDKY